MNDRCAKADCLKRRVQRTTNSQCANRELSQQRGSPQGYVPTGVLDPTLIVMVELPEPGAGIGLGLKLTVVPEGIPEADRAIALLNPPLIVVVIVDVP